jgi:hypothetical protein
MTARDRPLDHKISDRTGLRDCRQLDRLAREVLAARRDALSADDFAPLAYQAACDEGLDDGTGGSAGQLRFLIDPCAIVAGIPGVGVEDVRIVIEKTPAEVVRRLREEHAFLEEPDDEPPWEPAGAELPDRQDLPSDPTGGAYRRTHPATSALRRPEGGG